MLKHLVFCHKLFRMRGCSLGHCSYTNIYIFRRQGQADKGRCQEGSQQVVLLPFSLLTFFICDPSIKSLLLSSFALVHGIA